MAAIKWNEHTIEMELRDLIRITGMNYFPSASEMTKFCGSRGLAVAVYRNGGARYWAQKLGLSTKESCTKFGNDIEMIAMDEIKVHTGLIPVHTSTRHPYDILVDGSVKIDIKASKLYRKPNRHCYECSFNIEKKQQTCDLFIFYCFDDDMKIYKRLIIPSVVVSGQSQVSISQQSKWNEYIDKWEIINEYASFFSTYKNKPRRLRRVKRDLPPPKASIISNNL